jgi:hypothetical protein
LKICHLATLAETADADLAQTDEKEAKPKKIKFDFN